MLEQCCARSAIRPTHMYERCSGKKLFCTVLFCMFPIGWPCVAPKVRSQNFIHDTLQRGVHANPICNLRGTQGRGEGGTWGRKKTTASLLGLQIELVPAAQDYLWLGHFAPPDKSGSMLHVPAQSLSYVVDLSFLWVMVHA